MTPESIPQRNASFWKQDILLNKEYEKSFQEKDGVTAEDLDLSDTFIASLFEEASKDKEVIDRKEWIDRNYPRNTFDEDSSPSDEHPSVGRFTVVPRLRDSFRIAVKDMFKSN